MTWTYDISGFDTPYILWDEERTDASMWWYFHQEAIVYVANGRATGTPIPANWILA